MLLHRFFSFGLAVGVLSLGVACGSSGQEGDGDGENAEGALEQAPAAGNAALAITCQVLAETNECGRASICKASSTAKCAAKPGALASDPLWGEMCPRHGPNEEGCGRLSAFCDWSTTTQCVPSGSGNGSGGALPQGNRLEIACKTLGEFQQCAGVSICRSFSEASCKAKASAAASDPTWKEMCPRAGVNEQACGWQRSFCNWEEVSQCVPR